MTRNKVIQSGVDLKNLAQETLHKVLKTEVKLLNLADVTINTVSVEQKFHRGLVEGLSYIFCPSVLSLFVALGQPP